MSGELQLLRLDLRQIRQQQPDIGPLPVGEVLPMAVEAEDVEVDGNDAHLPFLRCAPETQLYGFQPLVQRRSIEAGGSPHQLVEISIATRSTANGCSPPLGGICNIRKNLFKAATRLGEILFLIAVGGYRKQYFVNHLLVGDG